MISIKSCHTQDTIDLGKQIGETLTHGISIALKGDLGAGKTTFVQGLAQGLGVSKKYYITSPTFTIINEYPAQNLTLCHLDLYRLGDVDELEYIGFYDLIDTQHVIIVEWPDLLSEDGFEFDINITFHLDENFNRKISVSGITPAGLDFLSDLMKRTNTKSEK